MASPPRGTHPRFAYTPPAEPDLIMGAEPLDVKDFLVDFME